MLKIIPKFSTTITQFANAKTKPIRFDGLKFYFYF